MDWLELTDLADAGSLERGKDYASRGLVTITDETGSTVRGIAHGTTTYDVVLAPRGWSCTCPVGTSGQFCKHLVATALLASGIVDIPDPSAGTSTHAAQPDVARSVAEWLTELSVDDVERILVELDTGDETVLDRLARLAARESGDVAPYAALVDELKTRRHLDWRDANDHGHLAHSVVDELEAALSLGNAAAMAPVIETGFRHVVRVILRSDDSSGIQSGAAGRLLDLHAQAVTLAGPDPVPLARRLVKMGVDEQDFFDVDVVAYAGVLDERGRATYRREIEKRLAKDPDSFRARRGLERLAVLERDPDAIVSLIGGDLAGPHAYLSVVEALLDAGLDDDALTIATDGIGSRLVPHQTVQLYDAAVRLLRERGDHQRILTLRREQLSRIPNRTSYTSLRRAAKEMSRWPEERLGALAMLLEHNQRDWLLTLLDEGETDLAWDAASRMRLDASLVLTLLRARAKTRPADVFDGYVELVDDVLTTAGQQNYRQAIGHLAELRRAAQAAERTDEYADYIAQLLEKHRRRPTLVEMLERTPRA